MWARLEERQLLAELPQTFQALLLQFLLPLLQPIHFLRETKANTLPHFGSGCLGESHHQDFIQRSLLVRIQQQTQATFHERFRLAGPCAGDTSTLPRAAIASC